MQTNLRETKENENHPKLSWFIFPLFQQSPTLVGAGVNHFGTIIPVIKLAKGTFRYLWEGYTGGK